MILVTGATGFLGSEVCRQLIVAGESISALRRNTAVIPAILTESKIDWRTGDLLNFADLSLALKGITKIYHCAAMVSFDPLDDKKLYNVNVEGTANLVSLCISLNIRLVHVSSVAALGEVEEGELIDETAFYDTVPDVHTYGFTKHGGELEVRNGFTEGLNGVIVNPSIIIGANAGFTGSGAIFKLVKDGLPFYTNGTTGFVAVEDVAACMIKLMNSNISGESFIVSAENYSYKDFFTAIAKGFNKNPPKYRASRWMLEIAWRTLKVIGKINGKNPSLTKFTARSSFNSSFYNNQKIKSVTDINFKPIAKCISEITRKLSFKP